MAYADGMNVSKRPQQLIHIQLDLKVRHGLLQLNIVARRSIDRFRNIFENQIEINFVFLRS